MIKTKYLRTYNFSDRLPQQSQEAIRVILEPLAQTVILDGNLVADIVLPATPTVVIPHRLSRPYKGYFVTRADGELQVWDEEVNNQSSTITTQINLSFSGTATMFSLWVY